MQNLLKRTVLRPDPVLLVPLVQRLLASATSPDERWQKWFGHACFLPSNVEIQRRAAFCASAGTPCWTKPLRGASVGCASRTMHLAPSFTNQRAVGANADERIRVRIAHLRLLAEHSFPSKSGIRYFPKICIFRRLAPHQGPGSSNKRFRSWLRTI